MNTESSNSFIYDTCSYQKSLYESISPLAYNLHKGSLEGYNKCLCDEFWTRYQLIDIESQLRNAEKNNRIPIRSGFDCLLEFLRSNS